MKKIRNKNRSGFSFIELIIVVAIMALISSVVLFKQAKFSSDILITNMAYQIALAIRQAEVFGLSSKEADTGSLTTAFRAGYGVLFTPLLATGGESANGESAFAMFLDNPSYSSITAGTDSVFNYVYDTIDVRVDPNPVQLTQGQKIKQYCGRITSTGAWVCWTSDDPIRLTIGSILSITFVKPNPEAHIRMGTESGGADQATEYDKAKITVQSALGDKCRTVTVSSSGEISVDAVVEGDESNGCDPELP